MLRRILWVLWPSFLVGGVAETAFFAIFDPHDLMLFGEPLDLSRRTVYSLGFFFFWATCAAASALTVFLQKSPRE